MRKILFILLIALLLVGAGFTIVKGFKLGNFEIWGVKEIIAQNEKIDKNNKELSDLVSVSYPNSVSELETSSKTLTSTKEEYEEKAILVSNSKYYMQTEKYEIEFLWTKLGNYAKQNNIQIKIDVVSSSVSGLYDLNFTIEGTYVDITEFIYDVENDSKLGFKIEDFHMPAEGKQATFSCKEIGINIEMEMEDAEGSEGTAEGEQGVEGTEPAGNTTDTENTANTTTNDTTTQATNEVSTDTSVTTNNVEEQTNTVTE